MADYRLIEKRLADFQLPDNKKWAIYGTGEGGKIVYRYFCERNIDNCVVAFVDNDSVVNDIRFFCGKRVMSLSKAMGCCDGIIIAAMKSHQIILDRILLFLHNAKMKNDIRIINIFNYYSNDEIREYLSWIEKIVLRKSDEFLNYNPTNIVLNDTDPKVIAWYLPQFHQIESNNRVYGKGFTEWTNTTQTIPMFKGHWQPHVPYDVGYYELNSTEVFKRQIDLAKHYGVYGFSFYYYWFSGKKVLEKPIDLYLQDKTLEFPFCITWANENWTALWDGGDKEIIFEQKIDDDEDGELAKDLMRYMKDKRYIMKDGKPVLIIYRVALFGKERTRILLNNLRRVAVKNGFKDLYILLTNAVGFDENPEEWGADALVEFPPHVIGNASKNAYPQGYVNPYFKGKVRDMADCIMEKKYFCRHNSKVFYRGVMTSWDNTARKATTGATVYTGLNPDTFRVWLTDVMREGAKRNGDDNFIFVNAWNEWAEGAHLEPDMRYGYGFLQAVYDAIVECRLE